jgi:hypothetical protein
MNINKILENHKNDDFAKSFIKSVIIILIERLVLIFLMEKAMNIIMECMKNKNYYMIHVEILKMR